VHAPVSQVAYDDRGLEAIVFTADGDMRQALNNLQATVSGFGLVNADNVFKVCGHMRWAVEHIESARAEVAHSSAA
jgi:DNA polymerase III delta prime subunit